MVYNGKPYEQMDDFGGFSRYFWKQPVVKFPGWDGHFRPEFLTMIVLKARRRFRSLCFVEWQKEWYHEVGFFEACSRDKAP